MRHRAVGKAEIIQLPATPGGCNGTATLANYVAAIDNGLANNCGPD